MRMTILDPHRRHKITGTFVKEWPKGITIDDDRGIRYYATHDLVLGPVMAKTDDLFMEIT